MFTNEKSLCQCPLFWTLANGFSFVLNFVMSSIRRMHRYISIMLLNGRGKSLDKAFFFGFWLMVSC